MKIKTGIETSMWSPHFIKYSLLCFILLFSALPVYAEKYKLLNPPVVNSPELKGNRIFYTAEFKLDRLPPSFWAHYNNSSMQLIIDFYSSTIEYTPATVESDSRAVIKKFSVENRTTDWSLSGLQSSFYLSIDPGWHYKLETADSTRLLVVLWKDIRPAEQIKTSRKPLILYMTSVTGAALLTFLFIFLRAT